MTPLSSVPDPPPVLVRGGSIIDRWSEGEELTDDEYRDGMMYLQLRTVQELMHLCPLEQVVPDGHPN